MKIGIIGVTGFVGKNLSAVLVKKGYEVIGFSRAGSGNLSNISEWRTTDELDLHGLDAIINLAGETVAQRWTSAVKEKLISSRVDVTKKISERINQLYDAIRPLTWINTSAVGFYGDRGDELIDENSTKGTGFLADLCEDWENAATADNVRIVKTRIGVVLGKGGAAWEKLRAIFSWGVGGKLGNGKQWMPWIHIDDLVGGIIFLLEKKSISGVVNLVAPQPVRNSSFTKQLSTVLRRPAVFPVPGFILRLVMGEFSGAVLGGQNVQPKILLANHYVFKHSLLKSALNQLVSQ
jgi:uncharacterized protein